MAAETTRRLAQDPALAVTFDRDAEELRACVRDVLAEVLLSVGSGAEERLLALCRRHRVNREAFDALGHHLLSALLPHRVGTDALVRAGAALSAVRGRLAPARADDRRRTSNSAAGRYRSTRPPEHLPQPPGWTCTGCGAEWPCATKQSQLLAEFGGASAGLAVYLGSCLVAAVQDLPTLPLAGARNRFLGWLPRSRI
ncbi:hypothetical protein [Micromonospora endolithica]|uniref:hypothetical protein n=1 Tax=Micromonospora endolithica TaxID=230091 RepID=UPI001EDF8061|nr:hypothetical protein [Micromonospora endolithica]